MMLSIVVPTYNRGYIITRAIKSVVTQDFTDWELLIIDDGSTDNTSEVLSKYHNDKRIRYIQMEINKGFFAARNEGIKRANGEWVCFLDSDDEYLPEALRTMADEIKRDKQNTQLFQFTLLLKKTNNPKPVKAGYLPNKRWNYYSPRFEEVVLKEGIINDMHRCLRSDIAKRNLFPEDMQGYETLYYASLAKKSINMLYVQKDVVLVHLDCADQLSNHTDKKRKLHVAKAYVRYLREYHDVLKNYPEILLEKYMSLAAWYKSVAHPMALWWGIKALLINPILFFQKIRK